MCMEDVRIGRKAVPNQSVVPVAATTMTMVVGQSADRYSILLVVSGAGFTILLPGPNGPPTAPANAPGVVLGREIYDLTQHGSIVSQPWYCYSTAACTVYVTETNLGVQ